MQPTTPPPRASLPGLPRELRDEIWTLALGPNPDYVLVTRPDPPKPGQKRPLSEIYTKKKPGTAHTFHPHALMHTSSQVHAEASQIYYATRQLSVKNTVCREWLHAFVPRLPLANIRIELWDGVAHQGLRSAESLLREGQMMLARLETGVEVEFVVFTTVDGRRRGVTLREVEEERGKRARLDGDDGARVRAGSFSYGIAVESSRA